MAFYRSYDNYLTSICRSFKECLFIQDIPTKYDCTIIVQSYYIVCTSVVNVTALLQFVYNMSAQDRLNHVFTKRRGVLLKKKNGLQHKISRLCYLTDFDDISQIYSENAIDKKILFELQLLSLQSTLPKIFLINQKRSCIPRSIKSIKTFTLPQF